MIEKHFRRREIEQLTGLSRSTIYELMKHGRFPRPIKLTAKMVAWPESSIKTWLDERAAQTGKAA